MKKITIAFLLAIVGWSINGSKAAAFSGNESLLTYCPAHGASTYYEYIDYIAIGTIIRTSGAETGGYYDGTALSTDVLPGNTYTLTYSHANPWGGYVENWRVYIDWNANGDFTDAGELAMSAVAYTSINYTAPINIPLTATAGPTRMRVIMSFYPITGPCGTLVEGEVEDYTLNILGGSTCGESYEPNNTKNKAKAIALETDILSQISVTGDIDWFSFSNSSASPNIQLTLSTLPANYNIKLFDPSGVNVMTSAKHGTSSEAIIYNTATTGKYTVKIYGVNGAYSNMQCYTLHVSVSSVPFRMEVANQADVQADLTLYPVPASSSLYVSFESDFATNSQVNIFNLQGEKVYTGLHQVDAGLNQFSLDLGELNNGMYFIQIISGDLMLRKEFEVMK